MISDGDTTAQKTVATKVQYFDHRTLSQVLAFDDVDKP